MILFIVPVALWLYNQAKDAASGIADFLRSIPSLLAPKPSPLGGAYTPPYTGGQCVGILYNYRVTFIDAGYGTTAYFPSASTFAQQYGALNIYASKTDFWRVRLRSNGGAEQILYYGGNGVITITNVEISRADNQPDNCGNLPNPTTPPSISDDGLFSPNNPTVGDNNGNVNESAIVLAPALPLVLVSAILAGYSAAMAAAAAASDALAAVKKIAEGLDALKTLWEKLKEFLDEWEKNRPKKRDIVRQTYGRILGDGALDFFPNNNTKFKAIQLDVVITNIPIGFGRYFGSLSPSRYRYKELGYIAFYSVNQGILEVHSIQFKRTSYQIPELAVGFIYHLGLDEQVKGYAFGTFSVEKT